MTKKTMIASLFASALCLAARPPYEARRIDFLARLGVEVNGAGPMLVRADPARNRLIVAHNLTASVSILTVPDHRLTNIATANRPPHYLKSEALALDPRSGNVYLIGDRALHVVFPERGTSLAFPTAVQYEMVAVDPRSGDAFLAGRESGSLAWLQLRARRLRTLPWCERGEKMVNLNATPPPPIRRLAVDPALDRLFAIDGYTSELAEFSATSGRLLKRRRLGLVSGSRWHWGGYRADSHHFLLAVETDDRRVAAAAKIDAAAGDDRIVALPGLTEGVGVAYHQGRDELYIAYDNHPTVHAVSFADGSLREMRVPAYGNDALALDEAAGRLYCASWAYGEIDQVDVASGRLQKRIEGLGILPHMFAMAFHPGDGRLYIPLGATAVNGCFGSALTVLDPGSEARKKIHTGWAPAELHPVPGRDSFYVFNSEDEAAEVTPGGDVSPFRLPCLYPREAAAGPGGQVCLAYGPHQSYWPVVYIWGAKNGILGIDPQGLRFYDRRIPRLAQGLAPAGDGALYALQNSWGEEKQFLIALADEVRAPNLGDMRLELDESLTRETTPRRLAWDGRENRLYICRLAERDDLPGSLQVYDVKSRKVVRREATGRAPVDLAFDEASIYVANFDSDSISVFAKNGETKRGLAAGGKPLKLASLAGRLYAINHRGNSLQEWTGESSRIFPLPVPGTPDNLAVWDGRLVVSSHDAGALHIFVFDPGTRRFERILQEAYPFGDTSFAAGNCAFFQPGQFATAQFEITRIRPGADGRLWVTDFLSGKLFIVEKT